MLTSEVNNLDRKAEVGKEGSLRMETTEAQWDEITTEYFIMSATLSSRPHDAWPGPGI